MYYDTKASGVRLKKLRKEADLTQEKLAEKLNISVGNLGKIENGRAGLSIDLLIEMASFYKVSVDYILLGKATQTDEIKMEIGKMINSLSEMYQKL